MIIEPHLLQLKSSYSSPHNLLFSIKRLPNIFKLYLSFLLYTVLAKTYIKEGGVL